MWQSPEKEEKKNKSFALTDITFYITAFKKKMSYQLRTS